MIDEEFTKQPGMSPLKFKEDLKSLMALGLTETQAIAYYQMHFQYLQDSKLRQRIQWDLRKVQLLLEKIVGDER